MDFFKKIKDLAARGFEINYRIVRINSNNNNDFIITVKFNGDAVFSIQTNDFEKTMIMVIHKIENDFKAYEYSLKGEGKVNYIVAEDISQALLFIKLFRKTCYSQIQGISEAVLITEEQYQDSHTRCDI